MTMNITLYQNDLPENHKLANAQSVAIDAESLGLNYKGRDKLCLLQLCSGDDEVYIVQFDRNNYKLYHQFVIFINCCKLFLIEINTGWITA